MTTSTIDITKVGQKTVSLPSFEGAKIKIKSALTVKEMEDIKKDFDPKDENFDEKVGQAIIVKNIISWNLAAGDKDLPISIDSIKMLPMVDFLFLVQEITGEQKVSEDGKILSGEDQKKELKKS